MVNNYLTNLRSFNAVAKRYDFKYAWIAAAAEHSLLMKFEDYHGR